MVRVGEEWADRKIYADWPYDVLYFELLDDLSYSYTLIYKS